MLYEYISANSRIVQAVQQKIPRRCTNHRKSPSITLWLAKFCKAHFPKLCNTGS